MHEYKVTWFDKYAFYSHTSIISLPGTNPDAVREYLKEHWTPSQLGIVPAYATAFTTDIGEPVLVVKQ